MTKRECAIIMAYTGYCMLQDNDLNVFYEYLSEKYGRPVFTHELVSLDTQEISKEDFIKLCESAIY